ncbi:TBC-domain-containing protein [Trematosphaeria pertusa]|uniref:TBC-domain-containing protein n=1 Tax=Trematosphaeria pertusa TaxID=390896 RepID=A0A6A6IYM9_9PLEO|nr:TBC-domain-containing protein [Trematosphaeria pertusa]KAF2255655.1 TBC-domain-containing protein [Trematosphaeria pertusa]
MAAAETPTAADLVRTSSQNSTASNSRKSSTVRVRPLKRSSNASLGRTPSPAADDKSLTSFPSLSPTPDSSPVQSRVNGWFRAAVGAGDLGGKSGENKPTSSPETIKAIPPADVNKDNGPSSTVRKVTKSTQQIVGSLVAATPSARDRSALFDDTPPEPAKVPGNLHYASDQNIEDMLEQSGAVALVRQLAGDLAQRDAQVTALRRRAEERERILRKMLQECEVSNMDIENRLRELDRGRTQDGNENGPRRVRKRGSESGLSGLHPDDPIDQRLARAMEDEIPEHPDALGIDSGAAAPGGDDASIHSLSEPPRETGRSNWRSYLWNGTSRKSSRAPSVASMIDRDAESHSVQTRSRASSGAKQPRKPISNDLFVPPGADRGTSAIPSLRRLQSEDQAQSTPSSRRSSVSIMNWTLKMVAGNNQPGRSSDKVNAVRGRKSITSDPADRTPSMDSTRTTQSSRSALARRGGRTLGPNGTIKTISTEAPKNGPVNPSPHPPARGLSNLGPVEMDRILPEESRPPTLLQHHNRFATSNEYLTDRFGFIYDQRRKKRQSEAAAAVTKQKRSSNVESIGDGRSVLKTLGLGDEPGDAPAPVLDGDAALRPPSRPESTSSEDQAAKQPVKTWADYLKLATHPTELLSHTPSAAPITTVESPEAEISAPKLSQVTATVAKRGSLPTSSINPEPSPSRIVSGKAEFSISSPSPGPASPLSPYPHQPDPVKSLLEQLTELHDNLQKEKTVKWNEFLRKVRAERKRQGDATNAGEGRSIGHDMPETLLTDGEIVGVAGLGNKGKVGRAKWQEFRRLVLGGIPVAYRAKIWAECSGASALRIPGYYEDLVSNGEDNPTIVAQIQMDITRTLTDNIFFRKGPGVHKLNEVLLAYSRRNPEVGYCQGMNLITACLLLIMPTAEDAFWVLATMIENILPQNYYDQHLLTSRADQSVLREYVVELLPTLSNHLELLEIELEALTFQWFLSVFTDCLSAEALYRVWDVVLCMHDGSTFLFQVALALLKLNEKQLLQCDTPAAIYHYINHQMTNHAISIDGLIQASDALNKVVKRKDVEERRERAVAHERDLMRQREEARLERKRKRASKAAEEPAPLEMTSKAPSISASLDAELSMHTSPMRTPLSTASRRSEEEEDADALNQTLESLTTRTPMPIEEESLWRA